MSNTGINRSRWLLLTGSPALLLLSACASFEGFLDDFRGTRDTGDAPAIVPAIELPIEAASHPNRFLVGSPDDDLIGEPQVVFTRGQETLPDLAREYGLGYDELIAANPDVNPWLPGEDTPILLPTQFILPDVPREGLILNIASKRLFYFPQVPVEDSDDSGQIVLTFPIGIGRVGWETPLGDTTVIAKAVNPHWWVPASVRREHAEMGDPLPSVVPPGPDNPLGTRVLKIDIPGYLIHGTNQPYGVGMRVSHGCVRLYPENIEFLYELVEPGESVRIINEPYLFGRLHGEWFLESHAPLEDDPVDPAERLNLLLAGEVGEFPPPLEDHARAVASLANGVPLRLAEYDVDEVLARVRRVQNTYEPDPDNPTLEEVRQMIDEAVAEADTDVDVEADETQ